MADFIRFRFHGAHGCTDWEFKYMPNVDDNDIAKFRSETANKNILNKCYLKLEIEEICHPGNEWLMNKSRELRRRAERLNCLAAKFDSMDTGRNVRPVAHHSV